MQQVKLVGFAAAKGDGAQAGAVDLYRNGVASVGDQHRGGRHRANVHYLAHDAQRVDDGLPLVDTIVAAFVEQNQLPVGINIDVDDFGDEQAFGGFGDCAQQFSQAVVFFFDDVQLLQLHAVFQVAGFELTVFFQ